MHFKDQGLPPAIVLGGLVVMSDVARGWTGWLDEPLLRTIGDLASLGRAALGSNNEPCLTAFFNLNEALITSLERELASKMLAHARDSEAARSAILTEAGKIGWTANDLERIATDPVAAQPPHSAKRQEPTGRQLALQDETQVFQAVRPSDEVPCGDGESSTIKRT